MKQEVLLLTPSLKHRTYILYLLSVMLMLMLMLHRTMWSITGQK